MEIAESLNNFKIKLLIQTNLNFLVKVIIAADLIKMNVPAPRKVFQSFFLFLNHTTNFEKTNLFRCGRL